MTEKYDEKQYSFMIVGNNHVISCYGKGRDGWKSFIADREYRLYVGVPEQYKANYATGGYLDVTPGLFAIDDLEKIKPFINEDGTYGTGVCEDYHGNWMLRRTLWTDADGIEHVAEGTVSPDGRIFEPISIKEHKYSTNTVYPLTDSWKNVWDYIYWKDKSRNRSFERYDDNYLNLVVPLSFFDYLQHYYKMYSFGELSSRTFLTSILPQKDGTLLLKVALTYYEDYNDLLLSLVEKDIFAKALISMEGEILIPLHICLPPNNTWMCIDDNIMEYLGKIADMPQAW